MSECGQGKWVYDREKKVREEMDLQEIDVGARRIVYPGEKDVCDDTCVCVCVCDRERNIWYWWKETCVRDTCM